MNITEDWACLLIQTLIKFNDGCPFQYNSKTVIYHLVLREKLTIRVYFETSHGKSKTDGLGSFVKSCAAGGCCK